ncbi:PREDICTED: uncharacterized protein LOC109159995 isoform X2 [Ipomoea nil]|uniref:uncharacterized protein LOC109159995 isoform X2 n=1 Tax=Ipomoea nil TaxID=35883 RepID=UPI000900E9EA|nr:PREDICTED: uncharacterized protein LOC109159995 isoform X2 [Ipomoea nil]
MAMVANGSSRLGSMVSTYERCFESGARSGPEAEVSREEYLAEDEFEDDDEVEEEDDDEDRFRGYSGGFTSPPASSSSDDSLICYSRRKKFLVNDCVKMTQISNMSSASARRQSRRRLSEAYMF